MGKWAAYTVTTIDQKANRRFSRIWMVALDGSHPAVPVTEKPRRRARPRWSPNGLFVAFLSCA
jgi:Tol biopolymer transport system component